MTDFLDALEQQLILAAARRAAGSAPAAPWAPAPTSTPVPAPGSSLSPPAALGRSDGRKHRRGFLILIPALLALAIGGLALGGVIEIGAPAKREPYAVVGFGPLTPGTSRLLPISTPDPHGGPAWGMRVFSTKRGVGCIQVGRLLDGRLGALGQDGAFGDDGRFHEIPAGSSFRFFACSALDGNGHIFNNVTVGDEPASAWSGFGGCVPVTATRAEKAPLGGRPAEGGHPAVRGRPPSICPQADERDLYYGLLGSEAESITYTSGALHRTIPTVGPEGAYLIVTEATPHQLFDFGGGTSDVVPVDGPITEIHYRDGSTCHLTARSWIGGASACTPTLVVPVGYLPVKTPTAAQVAAPLHARVAYDDRGEREILVSFVSRVPITEYRSAYSLKLDESALHGRATTQYRADPDADIAVGQTVTMRIQHHGPRGGSVPAGIYRGTVTLISATGPALYEGPGTVYLPVGSFSIRVP
jgi:hypothetical protein